MTIKESANREVRDSYIKDIVNPVPRRTNINFITVNGIKYFETNYENYWVSGNGDVFSRKQNRDHFLHQYDSSSRDRKRIYKVVYLYKNGERIKYRLHKLMMETFYGKCPHGYVVDHIDNNPQNNNINNLRYVTCRDNTRIACCGIPKNPTTNKQVIVHECETIKKFGSVIEFAKHYGLKPFQVKPHRLIRRKFGNYTVDKFQIGKYTNEVWLKCS